MRKLLIAAFCLFALPGFCNPVADSTIRSLQDKNLFKLDRQLTAIFDHDFLAWINPNPSEWPEVRSALTDMILERTKNFSREAQVVVNADLASILVREKQSVLGFMLIKEALIKVNGMKGIPLVYAYNSCMEVFRSINRLDSAMIYAEKVLDIAHEIKNDSIEESAMFSIGMICYATKNYGRSAYYFKQLIRHPLASIPDKRDFFNTLALTFRNRKEYDSSRYYFLKAQEYALQVSDTAWIGLVTGNIAYTYYLEKKYNQAIPGLLKDLDYSFRANNKRSALNTLSTLTNIFLIRSDIKSAKLYYDSLAHNINPSTAPEVQLQFLKTSADYYSKLGKPELSVNFLNQYIELNESQTEIANSVRASQLEAQFEFDRQLKKIETLESQSKLQDQASKQKNNLLVGILLVLLLGIGLIYVLYRSNRYKQETNVLLQEQNAQITLQAERLHELNATKDKLFSIIAHDLRGPINSFKSLLSMVTNHMITESEFRVFSHNLKDNVEQVHFTLNNLLHWASSQMQGIESRKQVTPVYELTVENFNLMSEPAKVKNIELRNNLDTDLKVLADPDQVRLVLRNLINNAIKFTPSGGHITVSSYTDDEMHIISVKDTGVGIDRREQEKLFQVFSTSTAGTSGEKGTGLGLLLCQEMVEKNGGSIAVISEPGKGTAFEFALQRG